MSGIVFRNSGVNFSNLVGTYTLLEAARGWLDRVFAQAPATPLPLWLRGSPFQLQVWQALLAIPEDANVSYGQIARLIGKPGAARAVGNAIGKNPVAWIIPCHRVIGSGGGLTGYGGGLRIKEVLLRLEGAGLAHRRPMPLWDR